MEENVSVRIDDDKKAILQQIAIRKGLLLSNYIRLVLYAEIERDMADQEGKAEA